MPSLRFSGSPQLFAVKHYQTVFVRWGNILVFVFLDRRQRSKIPKWMAAFISRNQSAYNFFWECYFYLLPWTQSIFTLTSFQNILFTYVILHSVDILGMAARLDLRAQTLATGSYWTILVKRLRPVSLQNNLMCTHPSTNDYLHPVDTKMLTFDICNLI
jgi:hypothetical protein